jgi:hypothetical protein
MEFFLWQNVLLKWERCNILDGFEDVLAHLPKPIRKSIFDCLANLKEKQLQKLVKGFLSKTITSIEHPIKGRRPNLKSMYKFIRLFKWKVVIRNEIITHFGHPKPTTNN